MDALRVSFRWVAESSVDYGDPSISVYLYRVLWANVNVVMVLPRIMVVDVGETNGDALSGG